MELKFKKKIPAIPFAKTLSSPDIRSLWTRHRWQFLIGLTFIIICTLLYPQTSSFQFSDLREDNIYIGNEIIAPFTFSVNKTPEEYERDKQLTLQSVYPVFVKYDSIAIIQSAQLEQFFQQLNEVFISLVQDSIKTNLLHEIFSNQSTIISEDGVKYLLQNFSSPLDETKKSYFSEFQTHLKRITRDLHSLGILDVERRTLSKYITNVAVRQGPTEMVEELEELYTIDLLNNVILQKLREIEYIDNQAVKIGYQILTRFLKPNLYLDQNDTNTRISDAVARVPLARGTVLENERIIQSHEKITKIHIQKLNSLITAKAELQEAAGTLQQILPTIGKIFVTALSIGLFGLFLMYWRPVLYQDISRVVLMALILLLTVFLAFLANRFEFSEYLILLAIGPMLLTVLFDTQVGFWGAASLAILLGSMRGNEYVTTFLCIIIGMVGALSVRKVRGRRWIFTAIICLSLAYTISAAAFAFLLHSPLSLLLKNIGLGLINALICPLLAYGMMVIFEYLFDVTTDATLLELSDLNRPLLKELALRAPGTYHHSLLVGTLSEAASEAIGANSLLARVGAYYHDIGKIEKPEYFSENQKNGRNPHDKLASTMSSLVIINHVKRGVEIAISNGLPKDLINFIHQHHGTNLVSYFFAKAKAQGNESTVEESNFRYPGPKPQTKETGIVMLADGVEATARSLREPSVSRIRNIVGQIATERFTSGELNECPLTLRDLNLIQDSFERTLAGIFHGRVSYSGEKKNKGQNSTDSNLKTKKPDTLTVPNKNKESSSITPSEKTKQKPAKA